MNVVTHKNCGVPREGLNVDRSVAETAGVHCKCCGNRMRIEELSSLGMQQLGMYRAVCDHCPEAT